MGHFFAWKVYRHEDAVFALCLCFQIYFVSLSQLEDTFTRCKKYSASLILFTRLLVYLMKFD